MLVLFQGPSGDVSPLLYGLDAAAGRVVPTWNYAVVHAHGRLRTVDDPAWLPAHMRRMTDAREAGQDRGAPWRVEDAPADYIDKLVRATVGIEIAIERLEGKWKASQNRSAAERARIVHASGMAVTVR